MQRIQNAIADADPDWHQKRRYTIVLGVDIANQLFIGPTTVRAGKIFAQETVFGQTYFGEGKVMCLCQRLH